jgi:hypothetical protein
MSDDFDSRVCLDCGFEVCQCDRDDVQETCPHCHGRQGGLTPCGREYEGWPCEMCEGLGYLDL